MYQANPMYGDGMLAAQVYFSKRTIIIGKALSREPSVIKLKLRLIRIV
jgi:hypothetical protein